MMHKVDGLLSVSGRRGNPRLLTGSVVWMDQPFTVLRNMGKCGFGGKMKCLILDSFS